MKSCRSQLNNFQKEAIVPHFLEVFHEYITDETDKPSLAGFCGSNWDFVVDHSDAADIVSSWNKRFRCALDVLKVKDYSKQQPDWTKILQARLNLLGKQRNDSPEAKDADIETVYTTLPSGSSSAKSSLKFSCFKIMTTAQWDAFEETYKGMRNEQKWELSPGVYVEDRMYTFAKSCVYEHPAHSFIIGLSDSCWESVFTREERDQLLRYKAPYHNLCTWAQVTVDELWRTSQQRIFDPVQQFDEDWSKRSITDLLSSYRWGVISRIEKTGLERDLVMRFWRCIDMCFDDIQVETKRSNQHWIDTSVRYNEGRLSADGMLWPKAQAVKPDLILCKDGIEYGCAEVGFLDDGGVDTEELIEKNLRIAKKIMKDMLVQGARNLNSDAQSTRQLRIVGFSHTHLHTTPLVMDSPAGYVCRVLRMTEHRIPPQPSVFWKCVIPFLESVWKIKRLVKRSVEVNEGGTTKRQMSDFELFDDRKDKMLIPSCMMSPITPVKKRKRK
ncbi:hypothetical protein BX666DRAFT_2118460 [Dichotomocladium elegans]|nr:hypothetical protein BX666DRAFT_2118460 [Dichotomocladium elegans]